MMEQNKTINKNSSYYNAQMVRVPRNLINLSTNFKLPGYENLNISLNTKWSDMARDYGNGNRTYNDERIDDFLVNDLYLKYDLWNTYGLSLNVTNIFNEKYETSRDYRQMDRTFNFGIKEYIDSNNEERTKNIYCNIFVSSCK